MSDHIPIPDAELDEMEEWAISVDMLRLIAEVRAQRKEREGLLLVIEDIIPGLTDEALQKLIVRLKAALPAPTGDERRE